MLTRKQHELLMFIKNRMDEAGVPPSFDEMKDALDLKSKSGIHRLITALEERGFIRRLPNRARALEVIKLPEGQNIATSEAAPMAENDNAISIPVMGRIAAGTPISAIQENTHSITVSPDMLGSGEHYALEVKGDSMVDAGILDGDTVVIRKSQTCDQGDIVVALVDDEEATLKRFRKSAGQIILQAENEAYEDREFAPNRVNVQGKLVGLIRSYH